MSISVFSDAYSRFRRSAAGLRQVRTLTLAAMLLALQVTIASTGVMLTEGLRLSFSFLATAASAMLLGPAVAGAQAAMADLLGVLLFPKGAFFPGYTFSALMGGLIYGFVLYERPWTWKRMLLAKVLVNLIVNIGLNTLWVNLTQGTAMMALLGPRITKNLILLPLEVPMLMAVAALLKRVTHLIPRGKI